MFGFREAELSDFFFVMAMARSCSLHGSWCARMFQNVTNVSTALESNALATVKKLTHTLKGSAGMIGASQVSDAAGLSHRGISQSVGAVEIDICDNVLIAELTSLIAEIQNTLAQTNQDTQSCSMN